jgi:hypothetical protein
MPRTRTETRWIVRTIKTTQPIKTHKYLRLKNAHILRRAPKHRSGRKRACRWELVWERNYAYQFKSLVVARRVAKIKALKDWIAQDGFVEIVEITGDPGKFLSLQTHTLVVVERPGCPPLLTLALEAV